MKKSNFSSGNFKHHIQLVLCQNIHLGLVGPLSPNQAFKTKSIGRALLVAQIGLTKKHTDI